MPIEARLARYAEQVDLRLMQLLPPADADPNQLHEAMRYSGLAPGKRLRPALCMASAEAVGGGGIAVLDAACALEMVHCFSLIHDDLPAIDNDALRRGRPTCHVQFGEAIAILAGDGLFALAFQVIANVEAEPRRVLLSVRSLAEAVGSNGLVGGEVADVLAEGREVSPDELKSIHARKTGALMAASCEIGALLGGGSQEEVVRLRNYGEAVGLAFQIADDLLNETSSPETLGKAAGSDRERKKATYPAVFGIEESRREAERAAKAAIEIAAGSEQLGELARYAIDRLH